MSPRLLTIDVRLPDMADYLAYRYQAVLDPAVVDRTLDFFVYHDQAARGEAIEFGLVGASDVVELTWSMSAGMEPTDEPWPLMSEGSLR